MRFPVIFFLWVMLAISNAAVAQPATTDQITWQLKNPFRYFKNPEHTQRHIRVLRGLASTDTGLPILASERALAKETDGRGWASDLLGQVEDEACWYAHSDNKAAATDRDCGAYIQPKSHAVLLTSPSTSGACTWSLPAGVGVVGQSVTINDCRRAAEIKIPYPTGAEVTLTVGGRAIASLPIKVVDVLVVGLGDSFASGEGNPDRPPTFQRGRTLDYSGSQYPQDEFAGFPQRDGLPLNADDNHSSFPRKGAGWLHRSCHRSAYSQQLRAALHLAVADIKQQQSVTFIGLACTGATILDLFNPYKGRDEADVSGDPAHASRAFGLSALSILSHALCGPGRAKLDKAKNYNVDYRLELGGREIELFKCAAADRLRKVDLLLLSIGGNDVGFSGLVANAALDDAYLGLPKLFGESPKVTPDVAVAYLERLPGRYAALADAIGDVTGITQPWRVVLTAFPKMGFAAVNTACPSGNAGMDLTRAWRMNSNVIRATETFMEDRFMPAMRTAATKAGWTFATAHRDVHFEGHGICAVSDAEANVPPMHNQRFPRYAIRSGQRPQWAQGYRPGVFRPYASTQRWFRTPNDAFLTVHFHGEEQTLTSGGRLLQLTSWSAYSGAFHPTAEGHAAIADAVIGALKDKPLAQPTP